MLLKLSLSSGTDMKSNTQLIHIHVWTYAHVYILAMLTCHISL